MDEEILSEFKNKMMKIGFKVKIESFLPQNKTKTFLITMNYKDMKANIFLKQVDSSTQDMSFTLKIKDKIFSQNSMVHSKNGFFSLDYFTYIDFLKKMKKKYID